jgi:CRP-like cAMP-binding protein
MMLQNQPTNKNHRIGRMQEQYWYLKNCRLFERLPDNELDALEAASRMRQFPAKAPIYLPVDEANGVFLLPEGRVKLCSLTPEGKQSILTFIEPGELFGELALFEDGNREEYAETTKRSMVILIPTEVLRATVARTPHLSMGISRLVGLRRRRIERRLKYLLFRSNRERLIHLLLELAEHYGKMDPDGHVMLGIRLSHQDLASIIGSTRESVTVILGQLQAEGFVTLGRRRITIRSLPRLARSVHAEPPRLQQTHEVGAMRAAPLIGRIST